MRIGSRLPSPSSEGSTVSVAWLANKLHEYGVTPEAGHLIMSGSFIKAIPLHAGDTVVALFDVLSEVTFFAE